MTFLSRRPRLLTALLAVAVFTVASMGSVRDYTLSDPQLTLLTSQVLWERGALDLRAELDRLGPERFAKDTWKYSIRRDGRVFYGYPLGAAIVSLPVVAVARTLGRDFSDWETDRRYQIRLASLCCALVFLLLADIAWRLTRDAAAPFFAFAVTLGSSLMSTLASALWSFNFELVFALLALREAARAEDRTLAFRAVRTGAFIAAAWVCRPSAILLAAPLGLFALLRGRRTALALSAGAASVLLPFLAFCKGATGFYFASYYAAGQWVRVANLETWPANLQAILFSPARGLFLFTPALLLGVAGPAWPAVRRRPVTLILATWAALTIGIVATQRNWWGGWSFGPRLLTETAAPLALLGFMAWTTLAERTQRRLAPVVVLALAWGIAVHTGQGLYRHAAYRWNNNPNIDAAPEFYRHNWRFPQFLATESRNKAKAEAYGR